MKKDYNIIIDTREQLPLWKSYQRKKLNVGDYSIEGFEDKIAIERKSALDLFGTLGKGHKRFKKELERSQSYDYFAIIIESSLTDITKKNFVNSYYSKMKGYVVVKILFTLHLKYGINIFFCNGRSECKSLIRNIFNSYINNNIYNKAKAIQSKKDK